MAGRLPQSSLSPKELLTAKSCPPTLLIICNQLLRSSRLVEKIVATFGPKLKDGSPGHAQISRVRGNELSLEKVGALRDDLLTMSLFAEPRFFLIEHAEDIPEASAKKLAPILSDLPTQTFVIFCASSLPATNPITQLCKHNNALVALEKLEGEALVKWTVHELSENGVKRFSADLPNAVIECAEGSPDEICRIVSQLALFVENGEANLVDLRQLFPHAPDPSEFELVDACSDSNPAKAELLFHQIVGNGKSPFMLLAIIARVFANFRSIRYLQSKGHSDAQTRQVMNMTPWVFNKNAVSAKRYDFSSLGQHARVIIKADSKLKNRSLGPDTIFSELFSGLKP